MATTAWLSPLAAMLPQTSQALFMPSICRHVHRQFMRRVGPIVPLSYPQLFVAKAITSRHTVGIVAVCSLSLCCHKQAVLRVGMQFALIMDEPGRAPW
jgi:hypothetical protein